MIYESLELFPEHFQLISQEERDIGRSIAKGPSDEGSAIFGRVREIRFVTLKLSRVL